MKKIILSLSLFITIVSCTCNNTSKQQNIANDTTNLLNRISQHELKSIALKKSFIIASTPSIHLAENKLKEVELEDSLSIENDTLSPINYHLDSLILTAFNQGPNVDCASIAFIKCAMATFGPDGVFKSINKNGGKYSVVLRNNEIINIDSLEVNAAENASGFHLTPKGDSSIWKKAKFIFAVIVKSATDTAEADHNSAFYLKRNSSKFEDVLKVVHGEEHGIDADEFPSILGFIYESIGWKDKRYTNAFIFENSFHAVFGECGCFDNYGTESVLNTMNFLIHMKVTHPKSSLAKTLFILKDQGNS